MIPDGQVSSIHLGYYRCDKCNTSADELDFTGVATNEWRGNMRRFVFVGAPPVCDCYDSIWIERPVAPYRGLAPALFGAN